jgi:hypothetical protein
MECTAVYMKNYEKIDTAIAAISPCIAKTHEFECNNLIKYNVTFQKLFDYLDREGVSLPTQAAGFDGENAGLGSLFSMPGGLKENIEYFLGSSLRIDRAEGPQMAYPLLDEYDEQKGKYLPDIFDVLNCAEGCNVGPARGGAKNYFEINETMNAAKKSALKERDKDHYTALFQEYSDRFKLEHFLRRYAPMTARLPQLNEADIERAYLSIGKKTEEQKKFDCGACGSSTCYEMARKIALKVSIPENCVQNTREQSESQRQILSKLYAVNVSSAEKIEKEIDSIKEYVEKVCEDMEAVNKSIAGFHVMESTINEIASNISIIAINASIESARLGDSGKAFGVIAKEIQNLAKATKEAMMESSGAFDEANTSVEEMNQMLKQILEEVTVAHASITEINKANMENDSTIEKD